MNDQEQLVIEKLKDSLRTAETRLNVLLDSSHAGIIVVDTCGVIVDANRRMAELFGCSLVELVGSSYLSHVHPDNLYDGDTLMRRLMAGEIDSVAYERHYIRKDRNDFWGFLSGRRHEDESGRLISLVGHVIDISDRKHAETQLREEQRNLQASQDFLDSIIENIPNMVFVKDAADLRFVKFNQAGEELLGISRNELIGKNDYDFFPQEQADSFTLRDREVLANRQILDIPEEQINTKSGPRLLHTKKIAVMGKDGAPVYLVGISEDITEKKQAEEERRRLEQQLLHAQKLESMGVLAGGIAHDFNNILMAILGNAELALMRVNKESPAVENLRRIEQAAARAADLARQMLAYSGKGHFIVESLDLNTLLEEMLHMLEVSMSKKAVLRFNLARPLPHVEGDATQLRQVIMNLMINASEAIGDETGVIAVTTGTIHCDRKLLRELCLDENLAEGDYVCLEITDSGCGMDQETMARVFDPFFTTKFTGRGLGMAAVLGIVRGHKGCIRVYSKPGKGATFKVMLPASAHVAAVEQQLPPGDDWHGRGTVLLVDDEEGVRTTGAEMLRELGFKTVTAVDGQDALEKFNANPAVSLVILDLTMPRMDGEQCCRELRRLSPDLKIIMSSGYSEQDVSQRFSGLGVAGFVQKPYRLALLKDVLK